MMFALKMYGGPLDGGFLPVHPRFDSPPTHLAVFCPSCPPGRQWVEYDYDKAGGVMAVDVYKIRDDACLTQRPPPECRIIEMRFQRVLAPEDMMAVDQMCREREQQQQRRRKRTSSQDDGVGA